MPEPQPSRPLLLVLTSHWVSMLGVALVTLAGFSWLFALPANIGGASRIPISVCWYSSRFPQCSSPGSS